MSREELEKRILEARYNLVSSKDKETIDILEELAIKALEQESILDEIEEEINSPNRGTCDYFIVDRIEEIIDKYRKE